MAQNKNTPLSNANNTSFENKQPEPNDKIKVLIEEKVMSLIDKVFKDGGAFHDEIKECIVVAISKTAGKSIAEQVNSNVQSVFISSILSTIFNKTTNTMGGMEIPKSLSSIITSNPSALSSFITSNPSSKLPITASNSITGTSQDIENPVIKFDGKEIGIYIECLLKNKIENIDINIDANIQNIINNVLITPSYDIFIKELFNTGIKKIQMNNGDNLHDFIKKKVTMQNNVEEYDKDAYTFIKKHIGTNNDIIPSIIEDLNKGDYIVVSKTTQQNMSSIGGKLITRNGYVRSCKKRKQKRNMTCRKKPKYKRISFRKTNNK